MKSPLGSLLGLRNQGRTPPIPLGAASAGHARGLSFNLGAGRGNRETYLRQYGASGTIYGIISLLAEAAATPTWHLYQKPSVDGRRRYSTGDQGSDQRVEVIQHAAIKLWNSPNDWHSGFEFREGCQQHEELTGETFWVLDTEAGFPTGMWYVRPDRMEPVPDPDQFLVGWIYTGPNGQSVPLKASEVIVEKRPDPLDPYRGAGPVASILPNIQQQKYATEYQRNLFLNGADPGGVITVPTNLSDAQFDQLIDRWRESHRGVARAGAVGVLEAGAEWSPNAHTNKDMEYGQLRLANRDELREAWRIHKTMMGTSDDVNRANAQTAQEVFVGWQVLPRLNRRRDTLNSKLLPLFGSSGTGVEFDYDDPSPQNAEAAANEMSLKATAAQTLVNAGYDPSDVLEVVGLPDMRVVEKATQAPALPPAWVPQQPAGAGAPGAPAAYAREVINAVTPPQTQAPTQSQQPPALLQAVDTQWKAAVAMLTAAWLATVTPRWISSLTSQVREQVGKGNLIGLAALTLDTAAATGVIYEHADAYAQAAANQAAAEAHAAGAPGASPVTPPSADLKAAAAAAAALAAQQLALTAGREATRLAAGPDPDPDEVAEETRTFLQGLSDAAVTGMAAGVMSMAQNTARLATIAAGPRAELVATEMHDTSTCLAPEAMVTTRRGPVRADSVRLSDELLTHGGRWQAPSRIVISRVDEDLVALRMTDGRLLRVTADHQLLVVEDGTLAWRMAAEISSGALVVEQQSVEGARKLAVPYLRLGQAPDGVAAVREVGGLAPIHMRSKRVPVATIRLDDKAVTDQEIHDPWSDLGLGHEGHAFGLKAFADDAFDARFQGAGDVAARRAVPALASLGRDRAEGGSADLAVDQYGGPSARFTAVGAVHGAAVPECGAAATTGGVAPTGVVRTLLRAVGVSALGGNGDLEGLAAVRAVLPNAIARSSDFGAEFGVGELALLRAVDGSIARPRPDFAAAGLAELCDGSVAAPLLDGARSAADAAGADRNAAVDTRSVHVLSVQEIAFEPYFGMVYDFTIPADQTFFAEGLLVHNCDPCDDINGTSFGYSDDPDAIDRARAAYPAGGYIACEGGTRCRGTVYGNYGAPVGNRATPGIQAKDAAAKVFEQTAQDYPPAATAWMHHATWSGPVAVPIDHIQPQIKWMDGADPQHVADFVKKRQQGKKLKPVILVKTPGNPRLLLVDGHHRYLAEAELDEPVRAFIGTVAADHGPWESMHDQQRGNAARNTAGARAAPGSGAPQHMADLVRRIQTDGYVPVEISAGRY